MNFQRAVVLLIALMFPLLGSAKDIQSLLNQEINSYIQELRDENDSGLANVANHISGSGLSDERLFDVVQDILLTKHQAQMTDARSDKFVIHQIVSLLRTLSSSGNSKYMITFNRVMHESPNRAIRNRAKHVMNKVNFYYKRNALMSNMDNYSDKQSLHSARILNLLNSNDMIMKRFAAEEIFRDGSAEAIVQEWLAMTLEKEVYNPVDKLHIDTLAWYCKALGTVNKSQYFELLNSIANDRAVHAKIRRHTKKILG